MFIKTPFTFRPQNLIQRFEIMFGCLILFSLIICCGKARSTGPNPNGQEKPLICVWKGEGRPVALNEIGCPDDFANLGAAPLSTVLPGISSVKLLIDQASLDLATSCSPACSWPEVCASINGASQCESYAIYFQDTEARSLHHEFASDFLNDACDCMAGCNGNCNCAFENGTCQGDCTCTCAQIDRKCTLPIVADINTFNAIEYLSPDRRFLLASVDFHSALDLYTLDLATIDTANKEMVEMLFRSVAKKTFFGNKLRFLPQSVAQEQIAAELPIDIPLITTSEIYASLDYQPLHLGEAIGQIRILSAYNLANIYVSPREIVVLDNVPNDISPVAAIITAEFQTPLSHINILSQNRGTPNMGLRNATKLPEIVALNGRWARLTVNAKNWSLEEVSVEQADTWWEEHRPPPLTVPPMDLNVETLIDLNDADINFKSSIGSKAANLAELQRVKFRSKKSNFDRTSDLGSLPPNWFSINGSWAIAINTEATSGQTVLQQSKLENGPHIAGLEKSWRNFTCSVNIIDPANHVAGLALLYSSEQTYYIARVDNNELVLSEVDTNGQENLLSNVSLASTAAPISLNVRVHDHQMIIWTHDLQNSLITEITANLSYHPAGNSCLLWTANNSAGIFDDFQLEPIYNPRGFAIPFFFFRQFMQSQDFDAELLALLNDKEFQTDGNKRRVELANLRSRMQNATLDPGFETMLLDKLNNAYPNTRMRFRSSTNMEDLGHYTGAGLYTSASGDLNDTQKPVANALKTVWASLFNFRAFEERELLSVSHDEVGMAVLVHRSFPNELANGVAITNNPFNFTEPAYYVNVQPGEISVTNPPPGILPDQFLYYWSSLGTNTVYLSHSTLTDGQPVMNDAEIHELAVALQAIHLHFAPLVGASFFAIDSEYKLDWPDRALVIKQARPFPKPGE